MRPEVAAEVQEWLERAVDDLREAAHDPTASPPLLRGSLFHSQQAAEKALKAFLAAHELPLRRTHDLDEIGMAVVVLDATLEPTVDHAKDLTPYAWRFRYPGAPYAPDDEQAREALGLAQAVYGAVLQRLPPEARP